MNALPEKNHCPKCGAALPSIGGLCAKCLARGALDHGMGWLAAYAAAPSSKADGTPEIDGWRIIGTLGAGGMGRVYHAESVADGTPAAIKVLDPRWSTDPAMVARFQNEARLLRSLDHPNIVRLIDDCETEDDSLCLITELVQGCDLGRLLRAEKLPHERAMEIFDKTCAAVEHAHAHGLIHRDIKPSNILIGRDGTVKLADFGLARETGDASAIGCLTATTDQFGTAYYLAPERMTGTTSAGPETDVYSLGVLLYHLLTGTMPLGKYSPLSRLTGLPREFDTIISKALEADPVKRTATVAELHRRVMTLWREHTAGSLRARKWKRAAAIAAGVALLISVAAASAWWQRERMKPRPVIFTAPSQATREKPWENSLGMKFVPVPGTKVLFSIYETRRRDVDPCIQETMEKLDIPWLDNDTELRAESRRRSVLNFRTDDGSWTNVSYEKPGWPVTPDHPAFCFSGNDALLFCRWLTWREQHEGRLAAHQHYRLPTTQDWLAACGGADAAPRAGNVAGPEAKEDAWPADLPTFENSDPFPRSSPVGSFPVETHGLYDLSGNVAEWVNEDPAMLWGSAASARWKISLRGPAFHDGTPASLAYDYERRMPGTKRLPVSGFRVVLEWQRSNQESPSTHRSP